MENLKLLRVITVQGHDLNIYGSQDDPLFLAVDVALLIDYSVGNTDQMLRHVDEGEKLLVNVQHMPNMNTPYNKRGNPEKWFLTENGLYEVLMQSRKPIARRFKRAVKDIMHKLRMEGKGDFEQWLNYEDVLVAEWEDETQQRALVGLPALSWEEFLECKGYTDDMLMEEEA